MLAKQSKRQSSNSIESSVTRLLVSTKHLLESLTQWARQEADDRYVSDSYVKLGNDFRAACRAFTAAGVDVSDLGDVPMSLRMVLEEALCEVPSQDSLDRFLPSIRKIIVNLLQNLKTKQNNVKKLHSEKTEVTGPAPIADETSPEPVVISEKSEVKTSTPQKKPVDSNHDALIQLQKGNSLQRRASKRYSAYQYAKLTNYSPGRDPELPRGSLNMSAVQRMSSLTIPTMGVASSSTAADSSFASINDTVSSVNESLQSISLFLRIGQRTKKAIINYPVSLASLRLLFVEKFAYSPSGGESFPDIYVDDSIHNVSYELEETSLRDLKDGSVVNLKETGGNETTSLMKKLEEQVAGLEKKLTDVTQSVVDEVKMAIANINVNGSVSDKKIETEDALESNRSSVSSAKVTSTSTSDNSIGTSPLTAAHSKDFPDIQHELRVIKQIQRNNTAAFKATIATLLEQVNHFQAQAISGKGSSSSNRVYMEKCHQTLSEDSDVLLTRVDDLQDVIEALRKDVAVRGARPTEKQLAQVAKELRDATGSLENFRGYIDSEKTNWKRIWESELDTVCEEQQFFNLQEDLVRDLQEDLVRATETLTLVNECCEEQSKNPRTMRPANLPIPEFGESAIDLRDALLNEVVALKPNHEGRLEAIERAEKLRRKEKELEQLDSFQEELGEFVEGNKLKKSGGIEEAERLRRLKDEENLRGIFGVV